MKIKAKTIDIQAKEWFDKVNGNSYFAGSVTVNYGMSDALTFVMPFKYGYGRQYEQEAMGILKKERLIDSIYCVDLKDKGIVVRSYIQLGCKKKELKEY